MPISLNDFLRDIMTVNVTAMGGASAGIIGSAGPSADTVESLKKAAIKFANEYSKSAPDKDELEQLEQEIIGYLKTLQLTYTLSERKADMLIEALQMLISTRFDQ